MKKENNASHFISIYIRNEYIIIYNWENNGETSFVIVKILIIEIDVKINKKINF